MKLYNTWCNAPFEKRALHHVFLNIENQDIKELKYIQLKII